MGDWDYYCALCGAAFNLNPDRITPPAQKHDHQDDTEEKTSKDSESKDEGEDPDDGLYILDGSVVNEENLAWLDDMQLVSYDEKATAPPRCRISKEYYTYHGYGEARLDVDLQPGQYLSKSTYLDMPEGGGEWVKASFPVHPTCVELFERFIGLHKTSISKAKTIRVNVDAFCIAMDALRGDGFNNRSLGIDYFELTDHVREQYASLDGGEELWVVDPIQIPNLREYPHKWSRSANYGAGQLSWTDIPSYGKQDSFSTLPLEIILAIFDEVVFEDLINLLQTCRSFYALTKTGTFWHRRLAIDMPYLWEINETSYPGDIDWFEVCRRLYFMANLRWWSAESWKQHIQGTKPARLSDEWTQMMDSSKIVDPLWLGIACRRRIYRCMQPVLKSYFEYEQMKDPVLESGADLNGKAY